jgi:hypothetical protein
MSFNIEDHIAASGDAAFQAAASFDRRVGGVADDPAEMDAFMNGGPGVRLGGDMPSFPGAEAGNQVAVEAQPGLAGSSAVEPLGSVAVLSTGPSVPPGLFPG